MGFLNQFRKVPLNFKEEIVESLKDILNTKQNFGAWQKKLGLRDYWNAHSTDATIDEMASDIRENIIHYETRLCFPQVKLISEPVPPLCFEVTCLLKGIPEHFYVTLNHRTYDVTTHLE